jgi:hypothetical protein
MAFLSYPAASLAYFWLSALSLITACFLTIILCPPEGRTFTALAVCAVLMTSGMLLRLGNPSTLSMALVVMGSMLFLNRSQLPLGAIMLAYAAGLKPQLAVPLVVFFCFHRSTRKYALGALGAFVLASLAACIELTYRLHSTTWIRDLVQGIHSAVGPGIETGLLNLSSVTQLLSGDSSVYRYVDLIVFILIALLLWIAFLRSRGDENAQWVFAAAVSYFTLLAVYHRFYDMRLQILTFPALGLLWRRSWKLPAVLTVVASMMLFSTAVLIENWSISHFGPQIAEKLFFRVFVERQQALAVLLGSVMWTVAALRTASQPSLTEERSTVDAGAA